MNRSVIIFLLLFILVLEARSEREQTTSSSMSLIHSGSALMSIMSTEKTLTCMTSAMKAKQQCLHFASCCKRECGNRILEFGCTETCPKTIFGPRSISLHDETEAPTNCRCLPPEPPPLYNHHVTSDWIDLNSCKPPAEKYLGFLFHSSFVFRVFHAVTRFFFYFL